MISFKYNLLKPLKSHPSMIILLSSILCACGGGSGTDTFAAAPTEQVQAADEQVAVDTQVAAQAQAAAQAAARAQAAAEAAARAQAAAEAQENTKPVASHVEIIGSGEVGSTLVLNSVFEDNDGDSEGSSIVAWTTPTVELQRGGSRSFVIPSGTEGETISAYLHPVDEHGAEGEPVRSENSIVVQGVSEDPVSSAIDDNAFTITDSATSPYEDLLVHATGYAKGIKGGAGGTVVEIQDCSATSIKLFEDSLKSNSPVWIRFKAGLVCTMQFAGRDDIRVGADKTIDGRGADITMSKATTSKEFVIFDNFSGGDFIIHNITFDDVGAIQSAFGSHRPGVSSGTIVYGDFSTGARFWFDHLTITKVWDDPFYIVGAKTTVSYIDGSNQAKQFIAKAGFTTWHHNLIDGDAGFIDSEWVGYDPTYQGNPTGASRAPYSQDDAHIHSYNNYLTGWWFSGNQSADGQVYSHNNVFGESVLYNRAPHIVSPKSGVTGNIYQFDNVRPTPNPSNTPWIGDASNGFREPASTFTSQSNVFTPPYAFRADPVGTRFNSPEAQALISKLKNQAGSQGVNAPQW